MSSGKRRVVVPGPRPTALREIQLVDRVEEMQVLKEAADRAVNGQGSVVFLYGEAGIGKTRLARELGAYARSRGMQVLSGRCPALFRMDGAPPYILWEEVVRDYLEVCTPEQLFRVIGSYPIEVSKLVPELKQKLRTFPQSFPLSPEHSRDRLFEAVSQFITNISREAPLLVVLDDLQWTDESSLLLMHYLARGVYRESLLILGAYRDVYVDDQHPLSPVLTELNRERLLQSVPLKRLSLDDASEMIKRILDQDDVPGEFCELVYEKTRGNPFFVEEVIKSLKEEEIIYLERKNWKIKEVSKIKFPKTVKSVIKKRIGRLDEEAQRVLTMASFVGKDFTFEALTAVTDIEEDKLLDIMERMLKTGLIKQMVIRGEDVCSFVDIIVRDIAYDEVSPFRRRRLHSLVGKALEKVYLGNLDEHFGELAFHFLESGDKEKALDYFLKAGEKAQKIYAYDEAFSYFQHALELLEEKEGNLEQKARLTEKLGDLKLWMGQFDATVEYANQSLVLWSQLDDKKNIARLHAGMASGYWGVVGDWDKASEHHQMALEILGNEPESIELASLYEDISHMLWRHGKSAEAWPWAQKAFDLAERLGDTKVLAGCHANMGISEMLSGEFQKAIKHFEEGLRIALESNDIGNVIRLYNNLAFAYLTMGEFQETFRTAQKGSEFARKVGALYGMPWLDSLLASSYVFRGELQKAISINEDILALAKRTKHMAHIAGAMCSLGACYQILGEWSKSHQCLMEAFDIAKKAEEYQSSGEAALGLGELLMEMGDYVEAEKYFNESSNIYKEAGDTGAQFAMAYPSLAKLHLRKGEIEKAEELIEKICEYTVKAKSRFIISHGEMLKAMLFREQEKWEQSNQHFEESLQGYKSMKAREWCVIHFAELLHEYGLMFLHRKEDGDKERAYSLLSQALEIYQEIDAKKKIEETKSKMAQLGVRERISETEPTAEFILPSHITTGFKDLDDLLFGGLPRDYAVILTSPSCDERDLLIKRFLETGAKNGEVTFYVTIDPGEAKSLTEEFPDFYLFICNPQADKIMKKLPNVYKLKGVENLTDINIALTSAFRKLAKTPRRARRICLEIISDVLLQHRTVQTRKWLTALLPEIRSEGFTTLAVMDPGMHSPQEVQAVLGLFEGEIAIYERGMEKFLKIKKMTNKKYSKDELPLHEERSQESSQ